MSGWYPAGTTEDDVNALWASREQEEREAAERCPECGDETVWDPRREQHCDRCGWSEKEGDA